MNVLTLLRSDPNVSDDFKNAVSADLRRDIAKRKAELLTPTLTRKVDLGDFGAEVEAEIEYDAERGTRGCWDTPATPGYFHVTAVKVNGYDIWPAFTQETQTIFENELSEALEDEARESEE